MLGSSELGQFSVRSDQKKNFTCASSRASSIIIKFNIITVVRGYNMLLIKILLVLLLIFFYIIVNNNK